MSFEVTSSTPQIWSDRDGLEPGGLDAILFSLLYPWSPALSSASVPRLSVPGEYLRTRTYFSDSHRLLPPLSAPQLRSESQMLPLGVAVGW